MARTGAILAGARAPRVQGPGGARPTSSPQSVNGPNFGQISPLAADLANEGGYARAYGNFLARPTQDFTQGAFGPFSPILPVPVNQPPQGAERPEPRRWQYPVGWNLPTGEPGTEGIKMCSFGTLRTLADIYSVARACIELRKNEIRGLEWDIIPTPEASKTYQGSPSQMADFGKRRAQVIKFFRHPDPDYFSWTSWIDALLEEVFVFDALSLFLRPKWGKGMGKGLLGSDLDSLELLNGATIRPLLDISGATPRPPAPAYQQYLYGVPRSDLMTMIAQRDIDDGGLKGSEITQFRGDQLLYLPMVPRTWTPYGFPPIERALIPIQSGLQKQSYQLDYFREGTVPSVFISPGDANMTPNQIRELQDALNAIAGDPAWKHKIIVLPPGSHIEPMHTTQIADQFDEVVMNQVCMAFDVKPMELGISPKVSTTQSPGAANQMAKMSQSSQERTATRPLLNFLCDVFEGILHRVCGQDDMMFTFEGLQEEEDQETMTGMLVQQVTNGFRSVDEAREELNLQPWGLPETSEPVMLTPTGPVPFGAASQAASAQAQASVAGSNAAVNAFQNGTATPPGVPGGGPQAPGKPGTPEEKSPAEAQQQGKPVPAQDGGKPAAGSKPATPNKGDVGGQDGQTPGHQAAEAGVNATSSAKPSGGSAGATPAGATVKPPAKNKAAVAELQALARHIKKGRRISTWEPAHLTGSVLASISEDLAKGLTPDEAVTVALISLPSAELIVPDAAKWQTDGADADPKVPAETTGPSGLHGWNWEWESRLEKVGPHGYIHGWIKVAASAVPALPTKAKQDAAIAEIQHGVDIQNTFIPHIVAKTKYSIVGNPGHGTDIMGVTEPGTVKLSHKITSASAGSSAKSEKDAAVKRGWIVPQDAGHSSADYFVAHETGHAISDHMSTYDQPQWNAVAKALGVKISPKDRPYGGAPFEYADIGNIVLKNKDAFTKGVSQFGASNPDELQGELWAEYTLSSQPRPAAKAYGDYIMKHLGSAT